MADPPVEPARALTPAQQQHQANALEWLIEGQAVRHILEALAAAGEKDPGAVIAAAADELRKDGDQVDPLTIRGFALHGYREIYRRALEAGDYAAALRAIKLMQDTAGS